MSDFDFEREDILPYQEAGFDGKVREVVNRMFREPSSLPEEFRGWLPFFIEQSNVQVPKSQVIGFASAEVPVGFFGPYGGPTAPTGWILCDGSAVSRSDQALLFAAIGTTWGAGDGSSTFNVPNLKGKVPVGLDAGQSEFDALAETGGNKNLHGHTHTISSDGNHSHEPSSGTTFATNPGSDSAQSGLGATFSTVTFALSTSTDGAHTHGGTTGSTGSGNAQNLQPYIVVNYIIKAV